MSLLTFILYHHLLIILYTKLVNCLCSLTEQQISVAGQTHERINTLLSQRRPAQERKATDRHKSGDASRRWLSLESVDWPMTDWVISRSSTWPILPLHLIFVSLTSCPAAIRLTTFNISCILYGFAVRIVGETCSLFPIRVWSSSVIIFLCDELIPQNAFTIMNKNKQYMETGICQQTFRSFATWTDQIIEW